MKGVKLYGSISGRITGKWVFYEDLDFAVKVLGSSSKIYEAEIKENMGSFTLKAVKFDFEKQETPNGSK